MCKVARVWPDMAMACALGAYFIYQLVAAARYPAEPALFPRIIGVAGVLLAIGIVIRALASEPEQAARLHSPGVALAVAAPLVYGLALWLLGYWVASLATLIAFPVMLGFRRLLPLVATAVGVALFFGIVLSYLAVRLPRGLLFERLAGS